MAILVFLLSLLGCAARTTGPTPAAEVPELRAPEPQDFTFGPGDTLELKVYRAPELDMTVTIAPDGTITLPIVGHIQVAGQTYPELVSTIETALSEYYVSPSVAVNVVEISSQKVFVLGEVKNPAVLQVEGELSILEALVRAGGIHPDARTSNVLLVRGEVDAEPELYLVDVQGHYQQGDLSQVVYLQAGDVVYVPTRTIANVERYFRRLQTVLAPFVAGSAVYRNAVSGGAQGTGASLTQ